MIRQLLIHQAFSSEIPCSLHGSLLAHTSQLISYLQAPCAPKAVGVVQESDSAGEEGEYEASNYGEAEPSTGIAIVHNDVVLGN